MNANQLVNYLHIGAQVVVKGTRCRVHMPNGGILVTQRSTVNAAVKRTPVVCRQHLLRRTFTYVHSDYDDPTEVRYIVRHLMREAVDA